MARPVIQFALEKHRGAVAFGMVRPVLVEFCVQRQDGTLFLSIIIGKGK